jgi:hypothetical protein
MRVDRSQCRPGLTVLIRNLATGKLIRIPLYCGRMSCQTCKEWQIGKRNRALLRLLLQEEFCLIGWATPSQRLSSRKQKQRYGALLASQSYSECDDTLMIANKQIAPRSNYLVEVDPLDAIVMLWNESLDRTPKYFHCDWNLVIPATAEWVYTPKSEPHFPTVLAETGYKVGDTVDDVGALRHRIEEIETRILGKSKAEKKAETQRRMREDSKRPKPKNPPDTWGTQT